MTITTNPARNEYTATAGQEVFNYTFKIYAATDLNVYVTPSGQTANDASDITIDYIVDPDTVGNEAGGFITFNDGLNAGDKVTIVSDIPTSRTTDYQANGDFVPSTVNSDIDRTISLIKQVENLANRTVQFQESQQSAAPITLPEPEAGSLLVWNSAGTGFDNTGYITPLASSVTFSNTTSGLSATNVQDAIDEVDGRIDALELGDYVPISGGTMTGELDLPSLQFTGGSGTQGTMSWNSDEETLDLIQNGATLQLGQESQVHCRNNTVSAIANGTVVMATGTLGASGRITIAPMVADGTVEPHFIIGVAAESIGAGEDGKVTTFGKVRGIDTSSFTEGAVLWCDPATAGALTATKPTAPNLKLAVAFVINSHAVNGTLMVRANAGIDLHNNHRVEVSSLTANDMLVWSGTRWENQQVTPSDIGAATAAQGANADTAYGWGDHSLVGYLTSETSHADVVIDGDFTSQGIMLRGATAGSYSILADNSANWNTAYGWGDHASAGYSLSSHVHEGSEIDATGVTDGYVLTADGAGNAAWEAAPASAGGISNVVEDTTPQLGGTLDANGNIIDMGTNDITDTAVGNWNTAYGWGDHSGLYLGATAKAADSNLLDGYDLVNGYTGTNVPLRDSAGDIKARLFRSNYAEQSSAPASTADICFRNNTTDNYMRFMTRAAAQSYLQLPSSSNAVNGYWKDNKTGVTFQWGQVSVGNNAGVTVTLPVAFGSYCRQCYATYKRDASQDMWSASAYPTSKSQIRVWNQGAGGTITIMWFAVGH